MPVVQITTTNNPTAIPGNPKRVSLVVYNQDSTNTVYMRPYNYSTKAPTSNDAEYSIGPGGSYEWAEPIEGPSLTQSQFQAIAGGGTPNILYAEGF